MFKLPIGLNSSTVQKFIDGIQTAIDDLEDKEIKQEEEINKLLDEAYEYAINSLYDLALYSDTDMTPIINKLSINYYDRKTRRGELFLAGGDKEENVGLYVEFGTGVRGLENQHPSIKSGEAVWSYDKNGYGEGGWWYEISEDNLKNPYRWRKKDGTLKAWTKGMPSRPFIYNTMLWLKDQVGEKYKVGFEFKGGKK